MTRGSRGSKKYLTIQVGKRYKMKKVKKLGRLLKLKKILFMI